MRSDGERLAVLETRLDGLVTDVAEIRTEDVHTRRRLHNLEGFAQAYLDTQKQHRRQEDAQYRRLTQAISLGGLAVGIGMLALALVTLFTH